MYKLRVIETYCYHSGTSAVFINHNTFFSHHITGERPHDVSNLFRPSPAQRGSFWPAPTGGALKTVRNAFLFLPCLHRDFECLAKRVYQLLSISAFILFFE